MAGEIDRADVRAQPPRLERDDQLPKFVEACAIVNSHLDETKLLYALIDVSVRLVSARYGRVVVHAENEEERLVLNAERGRRREGLLGIPVPEDSAAALVARGAGSVMNNHAEQDPRFQWRLTTGGTAPKQILCVPLVTPDGEMIGAIELIDRIDGEFDHHDLQYMELVGEQAGACLRSARLFARVQQERSWISSIVDSMSDGVVVADSTGRILLANEEARRVFSLDKRLHPPAGDLTLPILMDEVRLMGASGNFDYVTLKPQAEILSVRTTFLTEPDGNVGAIILGMRNVRELKEIERKNREFLSLVSHELGSHYDSIQSMVPANLEKPAAEIGGLIDNLVFYSEIEAGPMRLERRAADLRELVAMAVRELGRAFTARELVVTIEDGKPVTVAIDPERMHALIKGVMRLAADSATPASNLRTRILDATREARIEFDIEGLTLTEKQISDLFDKTYQVENYISILGRQTTGLGFVFLRHIAEAHGGSLAAEPVPGGGVRFVATVRK